VGAGRGGASGLEAGDALRAGGAVGLCADVAEAGDLLRSKDQELYGWKPFAARRTWKVLERGLAMATDLATRVFG
jgi:hypothetical protein